MSIARWPARNKPRARKDPSCPNDPKPSIKLCIDTLRFLAGDAVEKAASGYPVCRSARRRWHRCCGRNSSSTTRPICRGLIATASCSGLATARRCSTACSTSTRAVCQPSAAKRAARSSVKAIGVPAATRKAGGQVLNAIAARLPALTGGSADRDPSTYTALKGMGDFNPPPWPRSMSKAAQAAAGAMHGPSGLRDVVLRQRATFSGFSCT